MSAPSSVSSVSSPYSRLKASGGFYDDDGDDGDNGGGGGEINHGMSDSDHDSGMEKNDSDNNNEDGGQVVAYIDYVPDDVLVLILQRLALERDLMALAQTCRKFSMMARDVQLWGRNHSLEGGLRQLRRMYLAGVIATEGEYVARKLRLKQLKDLLPEGADLEEMTRELTEGTSASHAGHQNTKRSRAAARQKGDQKLHPLPRAVSGEDAFFWCVYRGKNDRGGSAPSSNDRRRVGWFLLPADQSGHLEAAYVAGEDRCELSKSVYGDFRTMKFFKQGQKAVPLQRSLWFFREEYTNALDPGGTGKRKQLPHDSQLRAFSAEEALTLEDLWRQGKPQDAAAAYRRLSNVELDPIAAGAKHKTEQRDFRVTHTLEFDWPPSDDESDGSGGSAGDAPPAEHDGPSGEARDPGMVEGRDTWDEELAPSSRADWDDRLDGRRFVYRGVPQRKDRRLTKAARKR